MADDQRPPADEDDDLLKMYERYRRRALRAFKVYLSDGSRDVVFAHYWDNTGPAGVANFTTIETSGRRTIGMSYASHAWWRIEEVRTPGADEAMIYLMRIERDEEFRQMPAFKGVM